MSGSSVGGDEKYSEYRSRDEVIRRLREIITSADDELFLTAPASVVSIVTPELREAVANDVLVLLLSDTVEEEWTDEGVELATVIRQWEPVGFLMTMCIADYEHGILADYHVIDQGTERGHSFAYRDTFLGFAFFSTLLGNVWANGREVYISPPRALPHEYTSYFRALIDANYHLQDGKDVHVTVTGFDTDDRETEITIEGPVTNIRQNIIYPTTNSFPSENTLFLLHEGERMSVGGPSAELEDLAATRMKLYIPDE